MSEKRRFSNYQERYKAKLELVNESRNSRNSKNSLKKSGNLTISLDASDINISYEKNDPQRKYSLRYIQHQNLLQSMDDYDKKIKEKAKNLGNKRDDLIGFNSMDSEALSPVNTDTNREKNVSFDSTRKILDNLNIQKTNKNTNLNKRVSNSKSYTTQAALKVNLSTSIIKPKYNISKLSSNTSNNQSNSKKEMSDKEKFKKAVTERNKNKGVKKPVAKEIEKESMIKDYDMVQRSGTSYKLNEKEKSEVRESIIDSVNEDHKINKSHLTELNTESVQIIQENKFIEHNTVYERDTVLETNKESEHDAKLNENHSKKLDEKSRLEDSVVLIEDNLNEGDIDCNNKESELNIIENESLNIIHEDSREHYGTLTERDKLFSINNSPEKDIHIFHDNLIDPLLELEIKELSQDDINQHNNVKNDPNETAIRLNDTSEKYNLSIINNSEFKILQISKSRDYLVINQVNDINISKTDDFRIHNKSIDCAINFSINNFKNISVKTQENVPVVDVNLDKSEMVIHSNPRIQNKKFSEIDEMIERPIEQTNSLIRDRSQYILKSKLENTNSSLKERSLNKLRIETDYIQNSTEYQLTQNTDKRTPVYRELFTDTHIPNKFIDEKQKEKFYNKYINKSKDKTPRNITQNEITPRIKYTPLIKTTNLMTSTYTPIKLVSRDLDTVYAANDIPRSRCLLKSYINNSNQGVNNIFTQKEREKIKFPNKTYDDKSIMPSNEIEYKPRKIQRPGISHLSPLLINNYK